MNKPIDLSTGIDDALDEKLKQKIIDKINKVETEETLERKRLASLCLDVSDEPIELEEKDVSLINISEADKKAAQVIADAILTKTEDLG